MCKRCIGVFDSGVGGMSVLMECVKILPHEDFVYIADKANMPYGGRTPCEIRKAALACADLFVHMNCKAIVVACNTATENAICDMRRRYPSVTFVGLEPAVRPCMRELNKNDRALALVTEATARSERFLQLVQGDDRLVVLPQKDLAAIIEKAEDTDDMREYVFSVLKPYRDAKAVILGCSHYALIIGLVNEFYGGRVKIYDGARGAASRLKYCLDISGQLAPDTSYGHVRFYSTKKALT